MKRLSNPAYIFCLILSVVLAHYTYAGDLEEANELFITQRYDNAIEKYNKALEEALREKNSEKAAKIHFSLGRSYEMKDYWRKALEHFQTIRDEYADQKILGDAMLEIGQCHVRFQEERTALNIFEQSAATFDDPWIEASSLFSKAILQCSYNKNVFDLDAAVGTFRKIINDYRFDDLRLKSNYWLGYALNRQKEYEQAIDAWQNVIKEDPETLWADFIPAHIAMAEQRLGQKKEMEFLLEWQNERTSRSAQILIQLNENMQNQAGNDEGIVIVVETLQLPYEKDDDVDDTREIHRITRREKGKAVYVYFIRAEKWDAVEGVKKITFSGNVRFADKEVEPSLIINADNIDIDTEMDNAIAKNKVYFWQKLKEQPHIKMENLDKLEFNLRTGNFKF